MPAPSLTESRAKLIDPLHSIGGRAQANPPDKFSHQPRLHQLARQLAESQPFDDDVLYAAAWLHDLGVFIGHHAPVVNSRP